MENQPKRFAAFDIDGTIFRWQLYHALFDEFHRIGIIDETAALPVFAARDTWQSRSVDFEDYENLLTDTLEAAMHDIDEKVLNQAAKHIQQAEGSRVYRYTANLMKDLKARGYTIIAISGSHQQLVERFAEEYPIDIVYGRQFTTIDGKIQGGAPAIYGHKAEILQEIVAQNNLVWDESYAIGDTNSDGDMMALVTNPIAFNPDRTLYQRARANRWTIVVERKNVIYKLRPNGTAYILE